MPRANRTVFSTFYILLIFLLCLFPLCAVAAASATVNLYEAPARDFARRIAASFPAHTRVGVDVRNRSTLAAADFATVRAALLDELGARGLRVAAAAADDAASVTITLSENAGGFVWVAEIRQPAGSSVMLAAVPRASTTPAQFSGITLNSVLLWSGAEHVLAAAPPGLSISPAAGAPNLLLLVIDGVTASIIDAQHTFKIALPSATTAVRDQQGLLTWSGNTLTAAVGGETCTLSAPLATSQPQCRADATPALPALPADQLGSERAELPAACGRASGEILATGTADYTQPDSVRAYEMTGGAAAFISPALDMPGPIVSLQKMIEPQSGPGAAALAVVRNLTTGDDEVYEISLVCGH
jgi:hypothetical protein